MTGRPSLPTFRSTLAQSARAICPSVPAHGDGFELRESVPFERGKARTSAWSRLGVVVSVVIVTVIVIAAVVVTVVIVTVIVIAVVVVRIVVSTWGQRNVRARVNRDMITVVVVVSISRLGLPTLLLPILSGRSGGRSCRRCGAGWRGSRLRGNAGRCAKPLVRIGFQARLACRLGCGRRGGQDACSGKSKSKISKKRFSAHICIISNVQPFVDAPRQSRREVRP
jgi:hypothetical protein